MSANMSVSHHVDSQAITAPQENEMLTLTNSIIEWQRLRDNSAELKQQVREMSKKMKVLEEVILRVMKNHNIGAFDLANTKGRVLFKKQKRQTGLGQKNMVKLMAGYMKSEEEAQKMMKYIQEHRDIVIKESISYEKLE